MSRIILNRKKICTHIQKELDKETQYCEVCGGRCYSGRKIIAGSEAPHLSDLSRVDLPCGSHCYSAGKISPTLIQGNIQWRVKRKHLFQKLACEVKKNIAGSSLALESPPR